MNPHPLADTEKYTTAKHAGDIAAGDIAAGDIAAGEIAAGDVAAGDIAVGTLPRLSTPSRCLSAYSYRLSRYGSKYSPSLYFNHVATVASPFRSSVFHFLTF